MAGAPGRSLGVALVGLSAAAFGTMAIFAVWAYDAGTSIWSLLFVRFTVAGLVMGMVVRVRGIPLPSRRRCLQLAAMGGIGYVGQSFCYFAALQHAQASLVALLLYLYPAFVVILAVVFLHERLTITVLISVAVALSGTMLLIGGGSGQPLGIALGISAAIIYSVYIAVGSVVTVGLDPLAVTTVICLSAAAVSGGGVLAQTARGNGPSFPGSAAGWTALLAIALVCTVTAILAFFAGLQRLGATRTAVISTLEPVVTVVLATALLAESMSPVQLLGGALVLVAVGGQAMVRGRADTGTTPAWKNGSRFVSPRPIACRPSPSASHPRPRRCVSTRKS